MDLVKRLEEYRDRERGLQWEGTFAQYFEIATKKPEVARLAHERIYHMIMDAGVETDRNGEPHYNFFSQEIFGIEKPLQQIVEYFHSAAQRLEVRKRVLLLMGPVGGGKSTIVYLIKRGLEAYSRTDAGALYAIKDCPMHEEPLHLIPNELRGDVEKEFGLYIEGDLCPHCRYLVDTQYRGRIEDVPVKRLVFSEKYRVGIGTFTPSDPKCVTGDTLVLTDQGLQTMEDIYLSLPQKPREDEFVPFETTILGINGPEKAAKFYCGGFQPIYEVETNLGYTIRGTANHPLLVLTPEGEIAWRKIGELQTGNYVALARGSQMFGQRAVLPESFYPLPRQPRVMTPDLAYWLGLLTAEGSVTPYETWFVNSSQDLINRFIDLTRSLFDLEAVPHRKAETYNYNVSISNKALCTWLRSELGIARGSQAKSVPASVLASSKEDILAFLEGLFWGDATIRGNRQGSNTFKYTSKSRQLARQVHALLLNLGVVGSLWNHTDDGEIYYNVTLRGDQVLDLVELIPSLRDKATSPLRETRSEKTNYDHLPHGATLLNGHGGDGYLARILSGDRQLSYNRARTVLAEKPELAGTLLADLVKQNSLWLTVREVRPAGIEPVYDLLVPGTHSFVADGFVQHNSQDISELVGGIDLSTIGEVGVESDPRAYRFDGELNIANRGIMEFVEMLKTDEKFLYVLLTLSQEQNIKTGRFSMIYADEVVVSHTNEHEYQAFVGNKKSEALQDRIILAKVPYNLRASDEVKIYEKLLKQSALQNVHIAPYTLRIASIFAILTRLEPSKKAGMSLMKKLKLYDGEDIEDFKQKDIKELQEEAVREGMDGISPRYVINRLSNALVKQNTTCINPIDALRALRDGLDQHTSITREERERYLNFISEARKEYDEMAKKEVQRAFVYSYEESARTLLNNYLDNVEAYCNKTKLRDPITDEEMEPDEQLMRSIEEQIGVTENAKKSFREEILIRISSLARKGMTFEYTSHERLKEAIEKKLFADLRDVVKITTSTRTPDKEQLRKINDVVNRLMTEHGYCHVCANEILRYTGSLLNR
ncbi:MAG TPA: LAGLIDADG family homing endonuclease [Ktedonobacteraceae bacterium]|nr:LAGLIDADG family homing endonuclease [Ktedonobacteraceae bacterium]